MVTDVHHKEPMILGQGSCPKHEKTHRAIDKADMGSEG